MKGNQELQNQTRELWIAGVSTSEICRRLGYTNSESVSNMARRLK